MLAFIIRRLLWFPILLIIVSLITFALGVYGPGDPVQVMVGLKANPAIIERVRHELGLDQPFYVQYRNYVTNVLQGNFGYSLVKYQGQPVSALLAKRLPVTIQLNIISLAWSLPLGIVLGVISGVRRDSWIDVLARVIVIAGISLPIIALLPVLTFAFSRPHDIGSFHLSGLLPVGGWDGIFIANPDWAVFNQRYAGQSSVLPQLIAQNETLRLFLISWSALSAGVLPFTMSDKIILPAFIEGLGILAVFTRQTRAGMIDELGKDYIRTARAKGLTEQLVLYRHALRNALVPLITIFGFLLAGLIAGSVLVERWYGIPGVGQLFFDSLFARDYYVIMAVTLLGAVTFAFANLCVDVIYTFVNPQIRYS